MVRKKVRFLQNSFWSRAKHVLCTIRNQNRHSIIGNMKTLLIVAFTCKIRIIPCAETVSKCILQLTLRCYIRFKTRIFSCYPASKSHVLHIHICITHLDASDFIWIESLQSMCFTICGRVSWRLEPVTTGSKRIDEQLDRDCKWMRMKNHSYTTTHDLCIHWYCNVSRSNTRSRRCIEMNSVSVSDDSELNHKCISHTIYELTSYNHLIVWCVVFTSLCKLVFFPFWFAHIVHIGLKWTIKAQWHRFYATIFIKEKCRRSEW